MTVMTWIGLLIIIGVVAVIIPGLALVLIVALAVIDSYEGG